jgi:proteasome lid subunit RPN8/RPN11
MDKFVVSRVNPDVGNPALVRVLKENKIPWLELTEFHGRTRLVKRRARAGNLLHLQVLPDAVHEAGAIILVHNHPSGSAKPSTSDIELTVQIVNACKTVNVSVHDHVIIGRGEYYSFKTNMLL